MPLTIADRRRLYADEYRRRWAEAKIDPERGGAARAVARTMVANRRRYEEISAATKGVPWWFVALAHNRESGMDFGAHLHEGSPLTGRTRDVPKGRPVAPPANGRSYTFLESAIDALTMPGKEYDKVGTWDVAEVFLRLEQYNGFGYRGQGIPSPYLWAGTNQSDERGKYVRDHVFDRNAPEKQLGCAAIMLALQDMGVVLFSDEMPKRTPGVGKATAQAAGGAATLGGAVATVPPEGWTAGEVLAVTAIVVAAVIIIGLVVRAVITRRAK